MNRNAMLIVAVFVFIFGAITVYYLRPIDESTRVESIDPDTLPTPVERTEPTPPVTPPVAEKPKEPVVPPPPNVPAVPNEHAGKVPEVDLTAAGVRKYTPLPMPAFFATDGMPAETQPINPLDFTTAGPKFVAVVKDLVAAIEAKPKDPAPLRHAILFLCRAGRPNEAAPYFDRYLAAGGTMKDLGEIVVSESGRNTPGEAIGGGLEFYIRGLAMVGRFKDALARQKELEALLPGFAETGLSMMFIRFYELLDRLNTQKNPVEAMYSLEMFNSVWPTGRYLELENQAVTAYIRFITEAPNDALEEMLPQLNQVWPHIPANTMQLITQDLLKRGQRPSPFMISGGDPGYRDENCNPAALIRRSINSRHRLFDLEQSTLQAKRGHALAKELQIAELQLAALWNLADVAHASRDLPLEIKSVREAEELSKTVKLEGLQLYTAMRIAALYEHMADERKAMETYLSVYKRSKERGASLTAFRAMTAYSRLLARFAKPTEVEATLKSQVNGLEQANAAAKLLAAPWFNLAYCYQRQAKTNDAAAYYAKVLQSQDVDLGMQTYILLGQLLLRDKNGVEAAKAFANAQEAEKTTRNPEIRWRAAYGLARSQLMQKDAPNARVSIIDAIKVIEAMPPSVVDYQQRRVLQDDTQDVWEFAIELSAKDGAEDLAFELAERCRSRAIQDVFGSRKNFAPAATLAEVKAVSGQKTILYLSMPDNMFIWVVSGNDVVFERIPLQQRQLYGEISAMLKMGSSLQSSGNPWQTVFTRAYDRFWAPISKHIKDGDRVTIIPHGILHYVPFAALYDGEKFVIDKIDFHIAATAGTMLELRKKPAGVLSPGLLLDPIFSTDPDSPFAKTETADILQLFPLSKALKGREATSALLLSAPGNTALLHLCSHGQYDPWLPMKSGFEIWRDGAAGTFTIEEAASLRIPSAQLVAFNSTPAGVKELAGGDDAAAIARAFQIAGARNVFSPIWTVDNPIRMELMKKFYENLKNNPDPVAALCATQRFVLKGHSHPYAWGGFVINGAGR